MASRVAWGGPAGLLCAGIEQPGGELLDEDLFHDSAEAIQAEL